ncbi:MAG: helix-turn-helix domain-containing protein [Hyphomicrobium sp.]|jgi:CRP/FNR family transcriptional regulator
MLATLELARKHKGAIAAALPLSAFGTTTTRPSSNTLFERAGTATVRRIEAREHVFCEGDPRTHVFQVEEGAIVIYKVLPDGRRQVIGFAYPGDLVGLGATGEHVFNAQAASRARVRCLSAHALDDAATRDASLALKLYNAVSLELSTTRSLLISIGQHSALERVSSFLTTLRTRIVESPAIDGDIVIHLPMRRSDIADFLGLTIETVSRTFTKLRMMRVIEIMHGTEVHVLDVARLEQLAGS